MQAITLQLLKDTKESHVEEIKNERQTTKAKVEEVLSLTKQQEIIIKKAKELELTINLLQTEIEDYRTVTKYQSDNLVKNI
jgi:hypothetical protein